MKFTIEKLLYFYFLLYRMAESEKKDEKVYCMYTTRRQIYKVEFLSSIVKGRVLEYYIEHNLEQDKIKLITRICLFMSTHRCKNHVKNFNLLLEEYFLLVLINELKIHPYFNESKTTENFLEKHSKRISKMIKHVKITNKDEYKQELMNLFEKIWFDDLIIRQRILRAGNYFFEWILHTMKTLNDDRKKVIIYNVLDFLSQNLTEKLHETKPFSILRFVKTDSENGQIVTNENDKNINLETIKSSGAKIYYFINTDFLRERIRNKLKTLKECMNISDTYSLYSLINNEEIKEILREEMEHQDISYSQLINFFAFEPIIYSLNTGFKDYTEYDNIDLKIDFDVITKKVNLELVIKGDNNDMKPDEMEESIKSTFL